MSAPRHRVLVVGAGSIGERHLRCFLATGRAQVSFVEPNVDLATSIAARYATARRWNDLDAALAAGIDAAVIATPAPSHVPLATRLAERGVHLLIEKPLAVTLQGVDALQQAVAKSGIIAGVAYVYRAHPMLAEMRAAVASGRFGDPVEIVAVCGQNFPTYRPAYRQTYYASHASGGGAVQDALTHILNAGQWLVGPIHRLVADVSHQLLPGVEVEDTAHVISRHSSVLGSYSLNQHQAPNEATLTVICADGTARFEFHNNRWREMRRPETDWIDHGGEPMARDELFTRQANQFLDAVEGKSAPLCGLGEATSTLRASIAILESAGSQSWQQFVQRS